MPNQIRPRTEALFNEQRKRFFKHTDRVFVWLMILQWIAGIVIALIVSPRTWIGAESQTHIHVWMAIFLGGGIAVVPVALGIFMPGRAVTRYCVAVAQMLFSALLIHLTGGRIETHFHVFGSLAFLAFYRDWKVLIPATIVVAVDHMLRGIFWPQSVFGVLTADSWRWVEHTAWVLFEDVFLIISCNRSVQEMWDIAARTAELEANNRLLEERVAKRTRLLENQAERLRKLAVELTQVEQKERRRLAEVLHDHLQQYLVASKMRLDSLERTSLDTDKSGIQEAREYVNKAVASSRQLTAELRPPVLYEGGLAAGLRYLRQKMKDEHKLKVNLKLTGDVEPEADIMKVMIYQCVQELLFNAVKYAQVEECFASVRRMENRMLEVIVKDNGVGFDVTLASEKKGFGLFSIRERVKSLKGEFKMESEPGKGATFTLCVPDQAALESNIKSEFFEQKLLLTREKSKKEGILVLVADDHPIIRQSIASLLMAQPFIREVIEAASGEEAIRQAEALLPDIILMDINMPAMNGIEATSFLCNRNPHLKIIGLSVQPKEEMAETMKDVGAVDYFNKGDDTNDLIASIRKFAYEIK